MSRGRNHKLCPLHLPTLRRGTQILRRKGRSLRYVPRKPRRDRQTSQVPLLRRQPEHLQDRAFSSGDIRQREEEGGREVPDSPEDGPRCAGPDVLRREEDAARLAYGALVHVQDVEFVGVAVGYLEGFVAGLDDVHVVCLLLELYPPLTLRGPLGRSFEERELKVLP